MDVRTRGARAAKFRRTIRAAHAAALAPCWLCGMAIDYSLTEGPDRWELDHFYTVVARPDLQFDAAHVRPSHSRCNRERGARAPDHLAARGLGMLPEL